MRKLSWEDIKAQIRWAYSAAFGFKRSIILLTGISTATSLLGVWSALLIKSLIDMAVDFQHNRIMEVVLLFILVLAVEIALETAISILYTQAKTKQVNNIQRILFRKFMTTKWKFFSARHSGDYCNLMISDTETVSNFLIYSIPDIVSTFAQLLAASWILLRLEPMLTLLVITITPLFILLAKLFTRHMREATIKIQSIKGENLSFSQEFLANVITVRTFEQQDIACKKLSILQDSLFFWVMRRTRLGALSRIIQSISWSASYILALMWGIWRLSLKAISYGSITAYLQLVAQIQGPLRGLASFIPQMITTSASIGRILEVLDVPEEELTTGRSTFAGILGIMFQDVSFDYQDGEKVLGNLDMEITPGVMTAIIGPTGAGKSTIVRLLLGLVEQQSGSILLYRAEGDIFPVGTFTRGAFTYVQQGNTAISGTIADNLRMAKADATLEEMETVLKQACAWDFVSALSNKMESRIGEHGIGLSEGQQQRLVIARALLRDAPILILDEATSALDKKTEAQVLRNIQSALQGRTCLVITHRSAALKLCSKVYKLYRGKAYLLTSNLQRRNIRFSAKKNRSVFKAASAS